MPKQHTLLPGNYIVMADKVMAYIVMAYKVMAHTVMAYKVVMAHTVMPDIVIAVDGHKRYLHTCLHTYGQAHAVAWQSCGLATRPNRTSKSCF